MSEKFRSTLYTVQKVRKHSDLLYGAAHASDDAEITTCGIEVPRNGTWFIVTNDFTGEVTCRKCLKILANFLQPS